MANPKRKRSKSKRDKHRSHWALRPPMISLCPECQEPKLPHCVCMNCGFYKNEMVIEIEEEKE